MNNEKKEKWLQRIMALIWLIIICCFIFNAIKKSARDSVVEESKQTENKQIENVLDEETIAPTEVTAE